LPFDEPFTSAPETLRYFRFLRDDGRILLICGESSFSAVRAAFEAAVRGLQPFALLAFYLF
jgi:hypothetical protein